MPASPVFQATLGEWRTVLEALKHYQQHLEQAVPLMVDEDGLTDQGLVAYDHMERIHGLIPSFEQQLEEYLQRSPSRQE